MTCQNSSSLVTFLILYIIQLVTGIHSTFWRVSKAKLVTLVLSTWALDIVSSYMSSFSGLEIESISYFWRRIRILCKHHGTICRGFLIILCSAWWFEYILVCRPWARSKKKWLQTIPFQFDHILFQELLAFCSCNRLVPRPVEELRIGLSNFYHIGWIVPSIDLNIQGPDWCIPFALFSQKPLFDVEYILIPHFFSYIVEGQ